MDAQLSSQLSDEAVSAVVADEVAEPAVRFSGAELAALEQLQASYQPVGDFLTADEVARLRFVRWLYQTGRVEL